MSYVSPTEGWGAPTEMSGIAAVDRGEVISSRPIMHPRHGNESADIEGIFFLTNAAVVLDHAVIPGTNESQRATCRSLCA